MARSGILSSTLTAWLIEWLRHKTTEKLSSNKTTFPASIDSQKEQQSKDTQKSRLLANS